MLTPDELDTPEPGLGYPPELYHVEANAYETFMLGIFLIHRGPPNKVCELEKRPKITDITLAFSRDGANWLRLDHRPFIACSREPGTWNRGYAHSAGGVCLVVGDQLYFYFGAWSGISPKLTGDMYAGGSTGLAVLRRDGFVSLDGDARGGMMTTPPLQFTGRYLFVNANAAQARSRWKSWENRGSLQKTASRSAPMGPDSLSAGRAIETCPRTPARRCVSDFT